MNSFPRSIGAQADVKELEYVAALQQTCPGYTRSSGTVSSLDVMRFLKSRYSLDITHAQAADIVLGLGGGLVCPAVRNGIQELASLKQQQQQAALLLQVTRTRNAIAASSTNNNNNDTTNNPNAAAAADDDDDIMMHPSNQQQHAHWKNLNSSTIQKRKQQQREKAIQRNLDIQQTQDELLLEEIVHPKLVYIDIVQMMSILLIPTVARYAQEWYDKNHPTTNNNPIMMATMSSSALYYKYQEELGRIQHRLQQQSNNNNKSALADEYASVEVGLSEMSYPLGAAGAAGTSTENGSQLGGDKMFMEQDNDNSKTQDLSPKPKQLIEFVLGRMWNQLRQEQQNAMTNNKNNTAYPDNNNNNDDAAGEVREGPIPSNDPITANDPSMTMPTSSSSSFFIGQAPMITKEMVQSLLTFHGEHERANDHVLVEQMVQIALEASPSGRFNIQALIHAISADILQDWKVGCEDRCSTCIYDVFGTMELSTFTRIGEEEEENNKSKHKENDNVMNDDDHNNNNSGTMDPKPNVDASATMATTTTDDHENESTHKENNNIMNDDDDDDHNNSSGTMDPKPNVDESDTMATTATTTAADTATNTDTINKTVSVDDKEEEEEEEDDDDDETKQDDTKKEKTLSSRNLLDNDTILLQKEKAKQKEQELESSKQEEEPLLQVENNVIVQPISAEIIDTVRDGFGSVIVLLLIWLTYICHGGTYSSLILTTDPFTFECEEPTLGCTLTGTIVNWLVVALLLSAFGVVVMLPISLGNHPTRRSPMRLLLSGLLTLAVTVIPYVAVTMYKNQITEPFDGPEELVTDDYYGAILIFDVVLGSTITFIYWVLAVIAIGRKHKLFGFDGILSSLWRSSDEVGTTRMKHAATRKINIMLTNARRMHGIIDHYNDDETNNDGDDNEDNEKTRDANFAGKDVGMSKRLKDSQGDPTFQNYLLHGERLVQCGSIVWTWKRLISGEIFDHEGIWFPARLWIFQFGQVAVAILGSIVIFDFIENTKAAADKANDELQDGLPQWVYDLVPTGKEVGIALVPAGIIAVAVMAFLIIIYIPSTATTILKFRCGYLPSLGSPAFNIARSSVDAAHMNTANAIYGMLAAGGLFFVLIGLVIFLFIWDFSQGLMLLLLAWGIGLTITILLKMIVTTLCRKRFYRAFYRLNPGRANLSILALECWFIGLGGGVLVGRITQFLLASAFWIGRIDEPFLADNVSLLGYKFDYVPLNYTKEILLHEAHRHPFIERLATMYLMRLRHKNFGSDAGSCWRQLFILTLMPWMVKYRVSHEQRCVESVNDQQAEIAQKLEEEATFSENIAGVGADMVGAVDTGAQFVAGTGKDAIGAGVNVGTDAVLGAVGVGAKIINETGKGAKGGVDFVKQNTVG